MPFIVKKTGQTVNTYLHEKIYSVQTIIEGIVPEQQGRMTP